MIEDYNWSLSRFLPTEVVAESVYLTALDVYLLVDADSCISETLVLV